MAHTPVNRAGGAKALGSGGFTLIEALVALAIASVCLLALFGLQRQLVASQRRFEVAASRAEAQRNVLALIRDLDPETSPEGSTALPDGERLSWASRPVSPLRPALTPSGAAGPYLVRLHLVQAQLTDAAGVVKGAVSVERMGWRPAPPTAGAARPQGSTGPAAPTFGSP